MSEIRYRVAHIPFNSPEVTLDGERIICASPAYLTTASYPLGSHSSQAVAVPMANGFYVLIESPTEEAA